VQRFLRKKDNPIVHIWSDSLAARSDIFECTGNGNFIGGEPPDAPDQKQFPTDSPSTKVSYWGLDKRGLYKYVLETLGVELDFHKDSINTMRHQVAMLLKRKLFLEQRGVTNDLDITSQMRLALCQYRRQTKRQT